MSYSHKMCFLCCGNVRNPVRQSVAKSQLTQNIVDSQLLIIFLIRKVLNVRLEDCEMFLGQYGNPSEWIVCCARCTTKVNQAFINYQEMIQLQEKLNAFQKKIEKLIVTGYHKKSETIDSQSSYSYNFELYDSVRRQVVNGISNSKKEKSNRFDWSSIKKEVVEKDVSRSPSPCEYENMKVETTDVNEENESDGDFGQRDSQLDEGFGNTTPSDSDNESSDDKTKYYQGEPSFDSEWRPDNYKEFTYTKINPNLPRKERLRNQKRKAQNTCAICKDQFDKRNILSSHMVNVHFEELESEEPKFKMCEYCDDRFAKDAFLKAHVRAVHLEKVNPFQCVICKRDYRYYRTMNEHHQEIHVGSGQFPCILCDLRYIDQDTLNLHILSVHEKDPKPFKCLLCPDHEYPKIESLNFHIKKKHMDIEENKSTFLCELCCLTFKSSSKLENHQKIKHFVELGLEPITCDREGCNWHFADFNSLKSHQKFHHDKKFNLFCPTCRKGFQLKETLDSHIARIHSGVKNFECRQCSKKFSTNRNLKRHMIGHIENKLVLHCDVCNKDLKGKTNYKRHMKLHTTEDDNVQCPYCDTKTFKRQRYLDAHIKSAHSSKEDKSLVNETPIQTSTATTSYNTNTPQINQQQFHTSEGFSNIPHDLSNYFYNTGFRI